MHKPEFKGYALTFEQQVDHLASQGLIIEDRDRAIHVLQNVSYSRLKSYMIPFMVDRDSHSFAPGTTFEKIYALYGFDRRFRELVFHELEKIEISIRARIAYASMDKDGGYWFTKPEYFSDRSKHQYLLQRIESEVNRSDNDSIKRFREKYSNRFPPCWLTLEATSMGTLSALYDAIAPGQFKRKLSEYYGVSDVVFASWLHHLVYVRNLCAHHSRLWNNTMSIEALVPKTSRYVFPNQAPDAGKHVYLTLCIIKYLIDTIKPANTFQKRLDDLLSSFPSVDKRKMGFPQ